MRSSAAVDRTLFSNSQFIALTLKRYYVYVIVLADCSALNQSARFGRARLDSARLGWFRTRSCLVSSHLPLALLFHFVSRVSPHRLFVAWARWQEQRQFVEKNSSEKWESREIISGGAFLRKCGVLKRAICRPFLGIDNRYYNYQELLLKSPQFYNPDLTLSINDEKCWVQATVQRILTQTVGIRTNVGGYLLTTYN